MALKKEPSPVNVQNYGKYKGKTYEQIFLVDPEYIKWLRDTTDPADSKNEGKYAKQNQARIKYLDNLLTVGLTVGVDEINPKVPTAADPGTTPVNAKTFESILQVLLKLEEKIDVLLSAQGKTVVTKAELAPDEETPF